MRLRAVLGREECSRVLSTTSLEEPDAGGAARDQEAVDVQPVLEHVRQATPVAVDVVEPWVFDDADVRPEREQPLEKRSRPLRVALAFAELGRVDLDEPDDVAVRQLDGVTVADVTDDAFARGVIMGRAQCKPCFCCDHDEEQGGGGEATHRFTLAPR